MLVDASAAEAVQGKGRRRRRSVADRANSVGRIIVVERNAGARRPPDPQLSKHHDLFLLVVGGNMNRLSAIAT
jgi:hypothetical protein